MSRWCASYLWMLSKYIIIWHLYCNVSVKWLLLAVLFCQIWRQDIEEDIRPIGFNLYRTHNISSVSQFPVWFTWLHDGWFVWRTWCSTFSSNMQYRSAMQHLCFRISYCHNNDFPIWAILRIYDTHHLRSWLSICFDRWRNNLCFNWLKFEEKKWYTDE